MKRLSLLFLYILIVSCAGTHETHFYTLNIPEIGPSLQTAKFPFTVGVDRIYTEDPYSDDRLIYRDSLFEVKFYHYHRWVASPSKMVTEMVLAQLKSSGFFQAVQQLPVGELTDYTLSGRIKTFEEWDEGNLWFGKVRIEFRVQKNETGEIVLQKEFTSKINVESREPVAVVQALSLGVEKCTEQMLQELDALFPKNLTR